MRNVETRFKYIIRTFGKRMGHPDNIRFHNCDTLQSAVVTLARQSVNPDNHKVEFLAVLETFQVD